MMIEEAHDTRVSAVEKILELNTTLKFPSVVQDSATHGYRHLAIAILQKVDDITQERRDHDKRTV